MKELNIANGNLSDTKNGIAGEGKFTSLNTEAQKMDESNSYSPSKEKHVTIQAEDIEIVPVKKLKETKEKNKDVKVGIFHLFHYSTSLERFLLILGIVLSVCAGAMLPLNLFIYGRVANAFIQHTVYKQIIESGAWNSTNISSTIFQGGYTWEELQEFKDVYSIATSHGVYFVLVGVGAFIFCFGHVFLWNFVQERQMNRIHKLFFKSCLRQEIGWFDVNESGELSSRFSGDMHMIADGLGDKISTSLQWIMTSIICYVLAFILGWKLALSTFGFTPFVIIMGIFITKWVRNLSVEETKAYSKAGAVAEEVLSSIRTVIAYNGQEKEIQRYKSHLGHANTTATKKGLAVGLGMSFLWILIYSAFAICFWYGVKLIRDGEPAFQAGNTLTIFIGCIVGSMAVGQALPVIEIIGTARGAAQRIFSIIETASKIDPFSACGEKPEKVVGKVVFQDVHFSYPARPEVKVMKGLSLEVQPGQTVALVGPSGCGKSTVIQLLQRFYDTDQGQVLLDGKDIKDLNVSWLRRQIGVVNQEPVLFGTTIEENIRFGKETATQDDIIKAAKNANAHEFISQLPKGYKTMVGERGAQLSGGQKQRIAIARALVRDPKILLLDEATSALDNESESIVQKALEKAQKGRTTIVVAHRLSTIRNADVIYCIEAGQEIEVGNHQELMNLQGMYSALVNLQSHKSTEDEEVELVRQLSKQEGQSNEMGISDIQDVVLEELEHEMLDVEEGEQSALLQQIRSRTSSVSKSQRLKTQMSVMSQHSVGNQEEENHHFLSPEEDEDEEKIKNVPLIKVLRFNSPEWYLILIACVLSVLVGVVQPSFAIIFGEFLSVFTDEPEEQKSMSVRLVGYLMAIAVGNSIVRLIMSVSFTRSGSKLTQRFRYRTFEAIVWQDIPFFDDAKNRVGALTARLSSDAALIQGAAGNRVGSVLEAVSTIACAFVIAFIFSWKLAFVMAAFMPLVIIAGAVQAKMVHGFSRSDKEANIEAGKIATETIDNIRTVVSLHKEDIFYKKYCESMDCLLRLGKKKAAVLSGAYSFSQAVMFFSYAAAFSYGGYLIQYENLPFENVFKVFGAIIFGGMSLGRNSAYAPDYNKGKLAASRLFSIIESKPKIDSKTTEGKVIDKFQGSVALDHVKFSYPARPNVEILKSLSIQASAGETLALVGTSGCGKSTTIQLIERFYDPAEGTVLMDNQDIRTFNLQSYRSHIGIVSQEPVLFDLTILENIAYGDNTRMVPMDEIIAAARKANIHNFIESLPQGYNTNIGEKGTQLSGGQKQRVAIARALVRNPRILLLDEATSALDSESERVVQDALDKAREGRTCFVIAHRLSTIRNADRIAIIHKGEVVELGSHSELIAKKGIYYKLLQHNVQKT